MEVPVILKLVPSLFSYSIPLKKATGYNQGVVQECEQQQADSRGIFEAAY